MIKILLLFFALSLSSSKTIPSVKAGINTTFDYNNDEFKYDYKGPGKDLMIMYANAEGGNFKLRIECKLDEVPGEITIGDYVKTNQIYFPNSPCMIIFNSTEGNKEAKGSFVIYNFNKELSIKLKNKYGNVNLPTYHLDEPGYLSISDLTFSIPNLERDVTVNFEYNNTVYYYSEYIIENPFKICQKNNCQQNISTYDFKKGESYKIIVKTTRIQEKDEEGEDQEVILIPGFTFYDKNYNGTFSPDDIIDDDEKKKNASNNLKIKLLFISLIFILF